MAPALGSGSDQRARYVENLFQYEFKQAWRCMYIIHKKTLSEIH